MSVKFTRKQKHEARRIALKWLADNPGATLSDAKRELPGVLRRERINLEELAVWVSFVIELIQQIISVLRKS